MKKHKIRIDTAMCTMRCGRANVQLTQRECELLSLLVANRGRIVSRAEILASFFREVPRAAGHSNLVDVYVRYVRRKLAAAKAPMVILTRRGRGYLLHFPRVRARIGA